MSPFDDDHEPGGGAADNDEIARQLEEESAELEGYFSDTPLDPKPKYPPLKDTFETAIIITNLPKVPEAKLEKLTKVVVKLVSRIGNLDTSESFSGVDLPFDSDRGSTLGFASVIYQTVEEAKQAIAALQGYKFDKNHSLQVMPYERGVSLSSLPSVFSEPEPAPFAEKPNTSDWLEDASQRDQFVVRQGRETVVYWSDGKADPQVDYDGAREKKAGVAWCEYYVQWSPHGSYLATLVPSKGVILWGGGTFEKLGRFPSPGVKFVLFSPRENYLLTNNNDREDPAAIKVFSIASGKLLRAFPLYPAKFLPEDGNMDFGSLPPPPPFQWSHDDAYLARMGKDIISIFETPSMKLLDRRSLTTDGIHEFQFSPSANIVAYWAPEHANTPAHVDLVEIPSRKALRQKNLFNVSKCTMVWHPQGNFLGVKVTRHTKSKKTLYNNLELFRVEETGIPVEMLDVKDAVMAFAWEPRGSRFAILHAENPSSTKVDVSFYDMKKKVTAEATTSNSNTANTPSASVGAGGVVGAHPVGATSKKKRTPAPAAAAGPTVISEVNKLFTLEGKGCNVIFWSPAGSTILLASLGDSASGTLEFYDVQTKSLTVKEHYRANEVLWDPSGRTVATCVSQPIGGGHFKYAMDNGYILWSFQGKQLYQESFETFYQLQWRPRRALLSEAEIAQTVVKNLKKYAQTFEEEDKKRARQRYLEETKEKRQARQEVRDLLSRLRLLRSQQKEARVELMNGYDSDDESNYVYKQVTLETIMSSKEEVVYA